MTTNPSHRAPKPQPGEPGSDKPSSRRAKNARKPRRRHATPIADFTPALDGRRAGQLAHRVIGDLLGGGIREPAPSELMATVAAHQPRDVAVVYKQAAKARMLSTAAIYFRFLVPDLGWRLEGTEVDVPGGRLDLLFRRPDGALLADELKTGALALPLERLEAEEQVARQLTGGLERFGTSLTGVRLVVLGAPRRSYLLSSDGGRHPILEED